MTAALVAALHGLKVTLFEASDQVGGTTSTSARTLWIPGSSQGARAGRCDSIDSARTYLDALMGTGDPRGLRAAYLSSAAEAIDHLEANSAIKFRSSGTHPDYLEFAGAATAGRAISPVEFDGRMLGGEFPRVRAPRQHFMVLGGMMVGKADISALLGRFQSASNFLHVAPLPTSCQSPGCSAPPFAERANSEVPRETEHQNQLNVQPIILTVEASPRKDVRHGSSSHADPPNRRRPLQ